MLYGILHSDRDPRTVFIARFCSGGPFLRFSSYSAHISEYITMILVSASFSYFTLAVPMLEVSYVGYTTRA